MKFFLSIVLSLVYASTNAQNNPKEYKDFDGKKQLVFADNFDDDKNGWLNQEEEDIDSTSDTMTIRNDHIRYGFLSIYNTRMDYGKFMALEIEVPVDFNRNYEIVFDGRITGKKEKDDVGVIYWGRTDTGVTGYNMYFSRDGDFITFYSSTQFDDSIHPDINKDKRVYTVFNSKDYNRYTIRHYNSKYYIFVNGILQCRLKGVPLRGSYIGLGASANAMGLFGNLSIYYLP